jgi:3-oxoacyl-(acyl-carrier-protein) synthase
MHNNPDVFIAGAGVISAVGRGITALETALSGNDTGLRPVKAFADPRFQSNVMGAVLPEWQDKKTWVPDDPAWSLATDALTQARTAAQDTLKNIPAQHIGLVLATTKANIQALERLSRKQPCSAAARRHLQADCLAADLAVAHHAQGPVQAVSMACVSGLAALWQGTKMIQRREAEAVLVVGVDCLSEFVVAGFTALKALDPLGCRPFDRDRKGLSPGEAGAAVVLVRDELLNAAPDQPRIKISGYGSSNDANHLTGPSRDGSGLAQAIRSALDSAGLTPPAIELVHAHGTGTPYNDAMESLALKTIFGMDGPPVSAAKGMLGHTLGAAGVIETIACLLTLQNNLLPGVTRLDTPAPGAPRWIVRRPRIEPLKTVLKVNTGFGGLNAALILQKL